MNKLLVVLISMMVAMMACQNIPQEQSIKEIFPKQLNLLQHGIPIAVQAPEDAKITNRSDNFMQDLVIEGTDYYVQIYGKGASSPRCSTLAKEALAEIKVSNETFQRVVLEDECGFVYEVQAIGDTTKCYNFAHFKVQGNKSFEFSTTTSRRKPFTQKEVENMYKAVQKMD